MGHRENVMPEKPQRRPYSGDSPDDEKLWFAYFAAASQAVVAEQPLWKPTGFDELTDPKANPDMKLVAAMQCIVGSAFAIEYRMKRVLEILGVSGKEGKGLNELLDCFWCWLSRIGKWDGTGLCAQPDGWSSLEKSLDSLRKVRNDIVHSKRKQVLAALGSDPLTIACDFYNAAIDAIRLVNWGTGYTNEQSASQQYWDGLKLRGIKAR